jgi:hypothetical protein
LKPLRRESVTPFMFATTSFFMYLSGNSNAISKSFAIDVLFGPDRVDRPSIASVFMVATLSPPSAARTPASTLFTSALCPTTSTSAATNRRQSCWNARFIESSPWALGVGHSAMGYLAPSTQHPAWPLLSREWLSLRKEIVKNVKPDLSTLSSDPSPNSAC